jgi:hypothetical protein
MKLEKEQEREALGLHEIWCALVSDGGHGVQRGQHKASEGEKDAVAVDH